MRELLGTVIGNNTIGAYLGALTIILFVLLLKRSIARLVASLLCRLFARVWTSFDRETFIALVRFPLGVFLVMTVTIVALYRLNFPPELNINLYKYSLQQILLTIGILLQIGALTWLLLRGIDFLAVLLEKRGTTDPAYSEYQLIVFFRDFLKVIVCILCVLLILRFAFGYNISTVLTGLSIMGAAIALALRESLENLIASFVIFFDKPFVIGDTVKVQQVTGAVESIGLRSTRIRTLEKSYVSIPNKQMVDSILDNNSRRTQIRGELQLLLHPASGTAQIDRLLADTRSFLDANPDIQAHSCTLSDIRSNGFHLSIEYFAPATEVTRFPVIRQEINFFVLRRMEELQLRLPAEQAQG